MAPHQPLAMKNNAAANPSLTDAFAHRLRYKRIKLGLRKQDIASKIGVSLTTITQYEHGQLPKSEFAIRLAQTLHCSIDWLLTGTGEEELQQTRIMHTQYMLPSIITPQITSGIYPLCPENNTATPYAFARSFLQHLGEPDKMLLLVAHGESMAPHILHNDMVLIATEQCTPLPGSIYAVIIENMIYLKIVDTIPGYLVFHSSHENYPPIKTSLPLPEPSPVRILGRAVWAGRSL